MSKILDIVKMTIHYFTIITVAVTIVSASYITVFYGDNAEVEVSILWQILAVSFLCSFCHLCFYQNNKREVGKKEFLLRCIICYIYVNAVVLGLGFVFEWFDVSSLRMVTGMLIAILVAFTLITGCIFLFDLKTTEKINQKLRERNGTEE